MNPEGQLALTDYIKTRFPQLAEFWGNDTLATTAKLELLELAKFFNLEVYKELK